MLVPPLLDSRGITVHQVQVFLNLFLVSCPIFRGSHFAMSFSTLGYKLTIILGLFGLVVGLWL